MSSAHYQALEPQTSDEDNEDIERPPHHHIHQNHPHPMVRKGGVARRRCILPLVGGALFFIAFCYLTLSGDTRIALGLGGGSEDSEEGSHHGLGKQGVLESRPADWLLRYTRQEPAREEFRGSITSQETDFRLVKQEPKLKITRRRHRFNPKIRESPSPPKS